MTGQRTSNFWYEGVLGTTHKRSFHVRCRCNAQFIARLYRTVNAQTDPALASWLRSGNGEFNHAVCPHCHGSIALGTSVIYHDPQVEIFVLVLPESSRHLEIQERAELVSAIGDETDVTVPEYVMAFPVVFAAELGAHLDRGTSHRLRAPHTLKTPSEHDSELSSGVPKREVTGQITQPSPSVRIEASPPCAEGPDAKDGVPRTCFEKAVEPESNTLHVAREKRPDNVACYVDDGDDGQVKLRARVDAVGLGCLLQKLCVTVQMHSLPTYPLVTVTLSGPNRASPIVFPLDVGTKDGRAVMESLAEEFAFLLELFDTEFSPAYTGTVAAPLSANMRYILAVVDEQWRTIPSRKRSWSAAWAAYSDPLFDRWGERNEYLCQFDERKLEALGSVTDVVGALDLVRTFSHPEAEQFLILVRGYPMQRWMDLRRRVLIRAFELGLWPGTALAHVALSEGLATSRKELLAKLQRNFSALCDGGRVRLADGIVAGNWEALKEEAHKRQLRTHDNR